jgi:nucleotide-binding universal stress UspA family protein
MLRVLVPSDGSPNSLRGIRYVADEYMKNPDLEIHVLNVQSPFSNHVTRFTSGSSRMAFHKEQSAAALAPARQALNGAGISYIAHSKIGDKADCIADAARRLQCDRIVMGTARKSSLVRWVEGSVTNEVIERTTVPVEVIAGDAASKLERVGIPAGIAAGMFLLWTVTN